MRHLVENKNGNVISEGYKCLLFAFYVVLTLQLLFLLVVVECAFIESITRIKLFYFRTKHRFVQTSLRVSTASREQQTATVVGVFERKDTCVSLDSVFKEMTMIRERTVSVG